MANVRRYLTYMTDDKGPFAPSGTWGIESLIDDDWEEKWERPRGTLLDTDRQYLWGLVEYSHRQTESERRSGIRERVVNGILDLFYLRMLEERDQDMIMEELMEAGPAEAHSAVSTLIEFLYLGFDQDLQEIEEIVSHGIHRAEGDVGTEGRYRGGVKEVNVDIEIDWDWDVEDILDRYEAGKGHSLTPAEIGILVREGLLDEEDLWELSSGVGGVPPSDFERWPGLFPDRKWFSEDEIEKRRNEE